MSESKPKIGSITWRDLTIENADAVKDFYCEVVGWESTPLDMGEYADHVIREPGSEEGIAGICHARGPNANIPPQWLVYITVENVAASAEKCRALGGKLLDGPRAMGGQEFCVIQDPAGAVAALIGG